MAWNGEKCRTGLNGAQPMLRGTSLRIYELVVGLESASHCDHNRQTAHLRSPYSWCPAEARKARKPEPIEQRLRPVVAADACGPVHNNNGAGVGDDMFVPGEPTDSMCSALVDLLCNVWSRMPLASSVSGCELALNRLLGGGSRDLSTRRPAVAASREL
eukprot:CAMPEP_0117599178 /NCGR_PEP_ID=MMETSP0784-20121206/75804_1 /TAXON_ID=39447 /ORGANISM="" /LENGTH=158 /DNA_ID=CAMNT_0005401703 /DNA_START=42 /DNA_END=520 /DNA_ORIENTATION=-